MSDIPKDWKFSPEPPQKAPTIDLAEYFALSALVQALIAMHAVQNEKSNPGSGQAWINAVSIACQEAISKGSIDGVDADSANDLKRKAMDQVNRILRSVTFKK